ncbi:MAG: hypothetical protein RMI94_10365 [Bryobacterales bacterium]|nr:DUF2007 domain-containing protein [Bryobacteraceae bacterium]MDW8130942.1 hypothetical protein [Bryobacterales bacterium]
MVTVFRAVGPAAAEQAQEVRELLEEAGLTASVLTDSHPGVPRGSCEVRVPEDQLPHAEQLIAANAEKIALPLDTSHELDLVTIFSSDAHDAEMEAAAVGSLLEANGIPALVVSPGPIPSLPYEVRVPRVRLEEARQLILAARETGPEAAEEAAGMEPQAG